MTLYDTFSFFNELDILEWRFEELYPVVDHFVLVESTHTHKGDAKPLHYARNRQRFARWNDKVIHIVVDVDTDNTDIPAVRRREMGQRNAILEGLKSETDASALVLVSDVDEIPRREHVALLRDATIPDGAVIVFLQTLYYYNVNTSAPDRLWPGTRVAHLADVRALSPHIIRNGIGQPDPHYPRHGQIRGGGWHFSYFGGTAKIQEKMGAFLHQELVSDANSASATIEARTAAGVDIWGREHEQTFVIGPASDLPWAIRTAPDKWLDHFHVDWRPTFHEAWYTGEQAAYIGWLAQQAPQNGMFIEIGCWEGRSSIALAQTIAPKELICVDHWKGNIDEGHDVSIALAQERDVYATFARNVELLAPGNIRVHRMDWRDYELNEPIAFAHIDGSHDYDSVADCIKALLPHLLPGAILCGDDLYADGVYRAVHDLLPNVQDISGRLWVWQQMEGLDGH